MRLSLNETHFLFSTALRAAGFPYGSVNAAVRMVQWAEIFHGNGLIFLERCRGIMPKPDAAAVRVLRESERSAAVDAGGQSALLIGPALLDLATAKARAFGLGSVTATRLRDLLYLGQLAELAANRGLACALSFQVASDAPDAGCLEALYSRGRGIIALPHEWAPLWFDMAAPSARHEELLVAPLESLSADFARSFLTLGSGAEAGVVLVCWLLEDAALARLHDDLVRNAVPSVMVLSPSDVAALKDRAIEDGFEVHEKDYYPLARFGLTTVIPSSEESRQQAGADG